MHRSRWSRNILLAVSLLVLGSATSHPGASVAGEPASAAVDPPDPPAPSLDLSRMSFDASAGRFTAPLGEGRAVLTLDPGLQKRLERFLASYAVPYGAVVLMEPDSGRVLALAEHSHDQPGQRGLALRAFAPAASIFKIVTAAALVERGVLPDEEVCYHGGRHRLQPRLLADDPRRDHRCATLASAFGRSTNVVFAKLAGRGLGAGELGALATRFLFNAPLPFAAPAEISRADIPEDEFGFASTAAGFGSVRLSPLHGALIASVVANRGVLVPPVVVASAAGAPAPAAGEPVRVVDEDVGEILSDMMRRTVTDGTARRAFHRLPRSMRGVEVAGKTGSLAERDPYRDYSWFIGFAPADRPRVAVAAVVSNGRLWRVRAPTVAREALEAYFSSVVADAGARRAGDVALVR